MSSDLAVAEDSSLCEFYAAFIFSSNVTVAEHPTLCEFYSDVTQGRRDKVHQLMEALRRASELGRLTEAIQSVSQLMILSYKQEEAISPFALDHMVRVLFASIPSSDSGFYSYKTALYYACIFGRTKLVTSYLCLLLLARLHNRLKIANVISDRSHTMQEWLDLVGYPTYFGRKELDHCVANASNDTTRSIIHQDTFCIQEIMEKSMRDWPGTASVISRLQDSLGIRKKTQSRLLPRKKLTKRKSRAQSSKEHHVNMRHKTNRANMKGTPSKRSQSSQPPKNAKRKNLPSLCFEDEFDLNYCPCSDEHADDESSFADTLYQQQEIARVGNAISIPDEAKMPSSASQSETCNTLDVSTGTVSSLVFELVNPLGLLRFDDDTLLSVTASTNQDMDWEVMSELDSVVSLGSTVPSTFRDAVVFGNSNGPVENCSRNGKRVASRWHPTGTVEPRGAEKKANENREEFDSFFIMEGVKGARGGRKSLMFKHVRSK